MCRKRIQELMRSSYWRYPFLWESAISTNPFTSLTLLFGARARTALFSNCAALAGHSTNRSPIRFQCGAHLFGAVSANPCFFCEAVASGAHSTSLKWLLAGRVDGTAIDSTVLEWLSSEHSQLSTQIRVIQSIGPSPVPPWVVSTKLTAEVRTRLRRLLCEMHQTPMGVSILSRARLERFVPAVDDNYDPIRRMACQAESVVLA